MSVSQICFLIFAAIYVIIFLFERYTGRAIFAKIKDTLPVVQALRILTEAVEGVYPSSYFDQANIVIDAAINATKKAEDLWKSGELPKEERSDYCHFILMETLKEAGVETSKQIEEITHGAIALTCLLLPHGQNPDKEEKEDAAE